ncbi:hypothetical protein ACFSLT_10565 [Novosphingobium resinovorum]
MAGVPILHHQALAQVQQDAVAQRMFSGRGKPRLGVQRQDQPFEALAKTVITEIGEPGLALRGGHQLCGDFHGALPRWADVLGSGRHYARGRRERQTLRRFRLVVPDQVRDDVSRARL